MPIAGETVVARKPTVDRIQELLSGRYHQFSGNYHQYSGNYHQYWRGEKARYPILPASDFASYVYFADMNLMCHCRSRPDGP